MIAGHVLQFCFDLFQGKHANIDNLCDGIKSRFITREHVRTYIESETELL